MTTPAAETVWVCMTVEDAAREVVKASDDWPKFLPIPIHNAITELRAALCAVDHGIRCTTLEAAH